MVFRDPADDLEGEPRSLWIERSASSMFSPLEGQLSVDVAVVGGGIAGLTTATLLKEAGKTVAVIEADRVGEGVTGHSTAKITAAHGLIYNRLISSVGRQRARSYAEANAAAIERIKALVDIHNIDCSFERLDAYTYTRSADDRRQIESEVEAASQLGLSASFTESVPVPFNVEAALQMPNQAQFNPTPYLRELATDLAGEGSYIFEGTKAMDLNTGQCPVVQTSTTSTRDRAGKMIVVTMRVARGPLARSKLKMSLLRVIFHFMIQRFTLRGCIRSGHISSRSKLRRPLPGCATKPVDPMTTAHYGPTRSIMDLAC
jgi:glycine/D-amino acid oxidase-like deaminating enzyme